MPGRHCRLLNPRGRQFRKRVLCPRPAARRPAAQAGLFPTQGSPVPSRMAVQAGVASAKGPLAAQPGSSHRAWGRAGHTPLSRRPAVPRPVGHDCGCPRPFLSWVGKRGTGPHSGAAQGPASLGSPEVSMHGVCKAIGQRVRAHGCFGRHQHGPRGCRGPRPHPRGSWSWDGHQRLSPEARRVSTAAWGCLGARAD